MAERDPGTTAPDDELSLQELESAAGGGDLLGDTPIETIQSNCGGNCNCEPCG